MNNHKDLSRQIDRFLPGHELEDVKISINPEEDDEHDERESQRLQNLHQEVGDSWKVPNKVGETVLFDYFLTRMFHPRFLTRNACLDLLS